MARLLPAPLPPAIAVMVSGGGDSTALLALSAQWAKGRCDVVAVTVDHGLRAQSAAEAEAVGDLAQSLGLAHVTLKWQWTGQGNLQAAARTARYGLVQDWRRRKYPDIGAILVGHTQDDQAETFLMRLARGSGVDGLAAMKAMPLSQKEAASHDAAPVIRPLLWATRAELRDFLDAQGMAWIDDPSNEDEAYLRVRTRRLMADLAEIGLDAAGLARTAAHMGRASAALWARAADMAAQVVHEPYPGILVYDLPAMMGVEEETRLRLLAHGLGCLTQNPYRPRLNSLENLFAQAAAGQGGTLHGVQVIAEEDRLILIREPRVVAAEICPADGAALWDRRWKIKGKRLDRAAEIRPLGSEAAMALDLPKTLPRAAFASYPALWAGPALVAVPFLARDGLCQPDYARQAEFHRSILSH